MLSLKELSNRTGIPYTTVARYTKTFALYFSRKREGRKILFIEPDAIQTALRVKELYNEGKKTEQIHEILGKEKTATIDVKPNGNEIQKGVISHMKKIMLKQEARINELENEVKEIKESREELKLEIYKEVNNAINEYLRDIRKKR